MENTVLLVVDVQTLMVEEHPYNEQRVISNIKSLIRTARESDLEVVYVRHEDVEGGDLERGSYGWQIYSEIAPLEGERIFDKHFSSAFLNTGLREYLTDRKVDKIILVGLQTEYCIDATCKSAFEHGFQILIPEETNTTFDNEFLTAEKLYEFYNHKIWNHRFAKVLPFEEVIAII
ncbi:MAG: nicotinamidase-like amidase [Herbinix sp.]|jgi:nicotinamidase-related amidase|nr:nicotinamidase-like amidase [Herbinix sp.]